MVSCEVGRAHVMNFVMKLLENTIEILMYTFLIRVIC